MQELDGRSDACAPDDHINLPDLLHLSRFGMMRGIKEGMEWTAEVDCFPWSEGCKVRCGV